MPIMKRTSTHEGTDTFRHRAAGAVEVALVTSSRWALIHELGSDSEPTLSETLARLSSSDIVVVEGYKREPIPKIEVRRLEAAQTDAMASTDPHVIAVASDHATDVVGRPTFDLNDVAGIADFVVARFDLGRAEPKSLMRSYWPWSPPRACPDYFLLSQHCRMIATLGEALDLGWRLRILLLFRQARRHEVDLRMHGLRGGRSSNSCMDAGSRLSNRSARHQDEVRPLRQSACDGRLLLSRRKIDLD